MQGIGSQLSKNVLGMKFMRKTKDELDKALLEQIHRHHFAPTAQPTTPTNSSGNTLETVIREVRSYGQVIGFRFGRLSFGGFNPVLEDNLLKRKWTPVHVHPASDDEDQDTNPVTPKRSKKEQDTKSEDEEAVYGSVIATCGKQFNRSKEPSDDDEEEVPLPTRNRGGWVKRGFRHERYKEREARRRDIKAGKPPRKKAKFMRPRDD